MSRKRRVKRKVKSISESRVIDYIGAGFVKSFTEPLLAPYVGNATVESGITKLALGYGVKKFLHGRAGTILSMALMIDGTEDIVTSIRGGISGNTGGGVI